MEQQLMEAANITIFFNVGVNIYVGAKCEWLCATNRYSIKSFIAQIGCIKIIAEPFFSSSLNYHITWDTLFWSVAEEVHFQSSLM